MSRHVFMLFILFLAGCAPVPASPTQPTIATVTQTVVPLPTPSAIPSPTPYPSLQSQGPHLLFTNDNKTLTIMDADGIGRKQIQLPEGGRLGWDLENTVSPDGNWIAYYTGSDEAPYDLALNLLNLSGGTSLIVSNLIAPGFPENLEPVTETIYFTEHDSECSNDPKCRLRIVQSAFREGLWHALDWSPEGTLLAFAAQIDGPSSDIYVFNTEDRSVRRVTDELENIWSIDWSPNSKKILYLDAVPGTIYLSRHIRIADADIKSLQHPPAIDGGAFWFSYGWVDHATYLIYNGGEGAPPNRFRLINIDTQQVKEIWNLSAESFFVDRKRQLIILVPYGFTWWDEKPEPGIYVVSFHGEFRKISDHIVRILDGQDATDQYIAFNESMELVSVMVDGSITSLQRKPDHYVAPRSSPDGKWVIITHETETELYSEELQLVKPLRIHATDIVWRPDSAGVFLYSDPRLYYLQIDSKRLKLIEECTSSSCRPYKHIWLP